jgi:hypothetical protein
MRVIEQVRETEFHLLEIGRGRFQQALFFALLRLAIPATIRSETSDDPVAWLAA